MSIWSEGGGAQVELELRGGCTLQLLVQDAAGRPILEPRLDCRHEAGLTMSSYNLAPLVLDGGVLEMVDLPPGTVTVAAGAPGLGTGWRTGVVLSPETPAHVTIQLGDGRGRFELIVRENGALYGGARLELIDGQGTSVTELDALRPSRRMQTGVNGTFTSQLLPSGPYRIRIVRPSSASVAVSESVFVIPDDGTLVTVEVDL